jgi:hypothetical protein
MSSPDRINVPDCAYYAAAINADLDLRVVRDLIRAAKEPAGRPIQESARQLYIGTGGDLVVVLTGTKGAGATYENVTYKSLPSGIKLEGQFEKIIDSGTTAADITVSW